MPGANNIWVFFGLIATGKSTLAEKWAARHTMAHFNSDRLRKELAGISPTASALMPGLSSAAATCCARSRIRR